LIGYSEQVIFTRHDIFLWTRASSLVEKVPEDIGIVRCHELARAVGLILNLPHQDGYYGFVDHSWLWTHPVGRTVGRIGFPHVLDVYSVGSMPLVRLVDGRHTSLPHVGWAYRPGNERDDIDQEKVKTLVRAMETK
jgi:hypothetical protein